MVLNVHRASQIRLPPGGSFYFRAGALTYRRHELIFPQLSPTDEAFEPLLSRWLILFSFSMIARYSPNSWTQTLSISSSPIASKVEFLLDTALDAVPDLVAEALTRLG